MSIRARAARVAADGRVVSTPGAAGYGDDALGFGAFPGQFGMVVYSRYPIKLRDEPTTSPPTDVSS